MAFAAGVAMVLGLPPLGHAVLDPNRLRRAAVRLEGHIVPSPTPSAPVPPPEPARLASNWRSALGAIAAARTERDATASLHSLVDCVAGLRSLEASRKPEWSAWLAAWNPPGDIVEAALLHAAAARSRFFAVRERDLGEELVRMGQRRRALQEVRALEAYLPGLLGRYDAPNDSAPLIAELGRIHGEKNLGARLLVQEWERLETERAATQAWLAR